MLLTMMRERRAAGFDVGDGIRDSREMNTVVFPEPVGNDTPMREAPERRAWAQASRQCSWYGRRTTGTMLEASLK